MSDFTTKVFRSLFTDSEWEAHEGRMANYADDCARLEAMTNEELAKHSEYYLSQIRCNWPKGSPVYDAVMYYNIIPELIKRLKS